MKGGGLIGEATGGEVFVSKERTARQNKHVERFLGICHAVFGTSFLETLVYSRRGRVIRSQIVFGAGGRRIRIGGRQVFWWLFPGRVTKRFSYEPYY
jgi:hypothetical protein